MGYDEGTAKRPPPSKTGAATKGEQTFRKIRDRLVADPGVGEGTGFGSNPGLRVGTKIFAILGRGDELVVKLPKERVDELVDTGVGARFDPRRDGRLMREWATIPARHARRWAGLAEEALAFVKGAAERQAERAISLSSSAQTTRPSSRTPHRSAS